MTRTPDAAFWSGRRVLVTGHSGFKGGWLTLWLASMGARVHGMALPPDTEPSMYGAAGVQRVLESGTFADIRDVSSLQTVFSACRPEVVFHLAAQPLVRRSYERPDETYDVNVMGLVRVLEAIRATPGIRAVVNVTTDKCYENESDRPQTYEEGDRLGGRDPYSSSKACAEIVTAAYRSSFLADQGIGVGTARAGNVIGGGDWSADRLVPDLFRGIQQGKSVSIRFPEAIRPWQHVLEPVSGYLILAERLCQDGHSFAESWNFGPPQDGNNAGRTVRWIVERLAARHPGLRWCTDASPQPHEALALKLDSRKAQARLGWTPRWAIETALEKTSAWYEAWMKGLDMHAITLAQIRDYVVNDG